MAEEGNNRGITRRGFIAATLGLGAAVVTGAVDYGYEQMGPTPVRELNQDWEYARKTSPEHFLRENEQRLQNVQLGCSFSPEEMEFRHANSPDLTPQRIAEIMKKELGMNRVRIGLRGDKVIKDDGSIDFGYYDPYIKAFMEAGLDICWNVDAFKVFRYNEHHLAKAVTSGIVMPAPGSVIGPGNADVKVDAKPEDIHDFSTRILLFNQRLLDALENTYPIRERLQKGDIFQISNEPFTLNGVPGYIASNDLLYQIVGQVLATFKGEGGFTPKILINSPGVANQNNESTYRNQLEHVVEWAKGAVDHYPQLRDHLRVGLDWYGKSPNGAKAWGADRQLDMNAVLQRQSGSNVFEWQRDQLRHIGAEVEITEMQMEPWIEGNMVEDDPSLPGNSVAELIFALKRCMKVGPNIVGPSDKRAQYDTWGIEYLLKHWDHPTPEQAAIRKVIAGTNALSQKK